MNGAEILMRTALKRGIEVCFANPGTTEMPIVEALDTVPGIRPVLGLFEGRLHRCSGRLRPHDREACHGAAAPGARPRKRDLEPP